MVAMVVVVMIFLFSIPSDCFSVLLLVFCCVLFIVVSVMVGRGGVARKRRGT